ncbi:hypothetical protein LE181_04265 [Streptomyces sp. SCA3-4]|uniref:hypothetical protein n=1 Tax=Streptomyces sichuanensis TaxID=2871810 RepID=UPI001CE24930|nr:hypothetical protein [Streptomyces sichuanensis]MCA6091386.1 hypothetical protein [Streptomyces sichuanensis]
MPVEVVFFNVGQGDCTFLHFYEPGPGGTRVSKRTVLLDCGTFSGCDVPPGRTSAPVSGTDRARLLAHLRHEIGTRIAENGGVLDALLISHPDQDHYRNLEDILCHLDSKTNLPTGKLQYEVGRVWYSCDPDNYREGNARGAKGGDGKGFVGRLLTQPAAAACPDHPAHKVRSVPLRVQSPSDPEALFPPETVGAGPELPNLFLVSAQPFGPHPKKWSPTGASKSPDAGNKLNHPAQVIPPSTLPKEEELAKLLEKLLDVSDAVTSLRASTPRTLSGDALEQRLLADGRTEFGNRFLKALASETDRKAAKDKAVLAVRNAGTTAPRWLIRSAKDSKKADELQKAWFAAEGVRKLGSDYVAAGHQKEFDAYVDSLRTKTYSMGNDEFEDHLEVEAVRKVTEAFLAKEPPADVDHLLGLYAADIAKERKDSNAAMGPVQAKVVDRNKATDAANTAVEKDDTFAPLPTPPVLTGDVTADNKAIGTYNDQTHRYNADVAAFNEKHAADGTRKSPLDTMSKLRPVPSGDDLTKLAKEKLFAEYTGELLTDYRAKTHDQWVGDHKTTWANASSMVFVLKGKPGTDGKHQQVWLMADAVMINEDLLRNRYTGDAFVANARNRWLKAGHHGSGTSTSAAWVTFLKPTGMFVSSGKKDYHIPKASHFQDTVITTWNKTSPPVIAPPDKRPGATGPSPGPTAPHHDYTYWQDPDATNPDFSLVWKSTPLALGTSLIPTASDKATTAKKPKPGPGPSAAKKRKLMDFEGQGTDWHLILDDAGGFELWHH